MLENLIEYYTGRIFLNFLLKKETYFDEDLKKLYDYREYYFLCFGFDKKCFKYYNNNVYGRKYFAVTLFWINVGGGYNYIRHETK